MGQFKPMVKMETTEPSVELKLKKGGKVHKKEKKMQMGGPSAGGDMTMSPPPGAQPMAGLTPPPGGGMPMPGRRPKKPNMFARRRAMNRMAGMGDGGASDADMMMQAIEAAKSEGMGGGMGGAPGGMGGGMGGGMPAMKKGGKAEMKALKEHAAKPASKAHKGLKTGGVVMGQGGYKAGGIIKTTAKKTTKMDTAHPDKDQGPTGGVKLGNAGGYKDGGMAKKYATGGVVMGQGGYKKGGDVKKPKATGKIASGAPVAMPQGRKPAPKPVSISRLAGTYKKGGPIMSAASELNQKQRRNNYPSKFLEKNPGFKNVDDLNHYFTPEEAERERQANEDYMKKGAVTETERSVTVVPGKKHGGRMAKGGSC
jgi:hypothetical protein